jgi:hypothetical protein
MKMQSSHWETLNSPQAKKAHQLKRNVKILWIVFFNIEEIVQAELVSRGTTFNSEYYEGLLERLRNDT